MNVSALKSSELKNSQIVLVVDKNGAIGEALAREFSKDYLVVLVSSYSPQAEIKNTIHVPFRRRIPQIPDNLYFKIFIVDDGESITRESAFSFIAKAKQENVPLYFIGSVRNVDIAHADKVVGEYLNSKVLILGDLFDKKIFFDKDSSINRFMLEARRNQRIEVPGNGLALNIPVAFSDTIRLIIKASYVETAQKIILLFSPHPITDISLANLFQKINPNIKVDFSKSVRHQNIFIPPGGQHAISKYSLEERIRELDLEDFENRDLKVVGKSKKRNKIFLKPILFFFTIILFMVLLPLLTTSVYSFLAVKELSDAKTFAQKGDLENALNKTNNSKTFFETAHKTSNALILEARFMGMQKDAQKLTDKIEGGIGVSRAAIYLLEGSITLRDVYKGDSKDVKGGFVNALNSIKSGVVLLQRVKAEGNLPDEFSKNLRNLEPFIDLFSSSSDVLLNILGFESEKNYLLLFQNNMEIRPGGGSIESVGILKIKDGKIKDFSIFDTRTLDGQLKALVDPPFALRRYLPTSRLFLRDSNFDPDFVNSAIKVSAMYSLETGNKVDGVIGMDLSFAKNIISAIGPIDVKGYEKRVDAENLYAVVQENSKENSSLIIARSFEQAFKKKKDIPCLLLAENIGKSIKEKDLIFAFQSPGVQNIFTVNGWSSSLWDNREEGNGSINDFVGISEANLGTNKMNYFVSRSVSKKLIILDDGKVLSTITVGLKNNSASNNSGNYKNYMQLILPYGSKITSVVIDNKESKVREAVVDPRVYESKNFKPPFGIEVEERREMEKSVFGFLVTVGPGEIKNITISYSLPYSISPAQKSINYSLKIFKQPGIAPYPFDLSFSLPSVYKLSDKKTPYLQDVLGDENLLFTIVQK